MRTETVAVLVLLVSGCGGLSGTETSPWGPGDARTADTGPEDSGPGLDAGGGPGVIWAQDGAVTVPIHVVTPVVGQDAGTGPCHEIDGGYFPGSCPEGYPKHILCETGPLPGCKVWNANPAGWALCCP